MERVSKDTFLKYDNICSVKSLSVYAAVIHLYKDKDFLLFVYDVKPTNNCRPTFW